MSAMTKGEPVAGVEHLELVVGRHVGQHHHRRGGGGGRQLDLPVLEHVDGDPVGGALVHVVVVFAGPGERGAGRALDAVEGDPVAGQHVEVLLGVVGADDADQVDRAGEVAGGERGVGGRAAQQIGGVGVRGLDLVDGDGAADGDGGWRMADGGIGHGRGLPDAGGGVKEGRRPRRPWHPPAMEGRRPRRPWHPPAMEGRRPRRPWHPPAMGDGRRPRRPCLASNGGPASPRAVISGGGATDAGDGVPPFEVPP